MAGQAGPSADGIFRGLHVVVSQLEPSVIAGMIKRLRANGATATAQMSASGNRCSHLVLGQPRGNKWSVAIGRPTDAGEGGPEMRAFQPGEVDASARESAVRLALSSQRLWVVNAKWVHDCLERGRVLLEDDYSWVRKSRRSDGPAAEAPPSKRPRAANTAAPGGDSPTRFDGEAAAPVPGASAAAGPARPPAASTASQARPTAAGSAPALDKRPQGAGLAHAGVSVDDGTAGQTSQAVGAARTGAERQGGSDAKGLDQAGGEPGEAPACAPGSDSAPPALGDVGDRTTKALPSRLRAHTVLSSLAGLDGAARQRPVPPMASPGTAGGATGANPAVALRPPEQVGGQAPSTAANTHAAPSPVAHTSGAAASPCASTPGSGAQGHPSDAEGTPVSVSSRPPPHRTAAPPQLPAAAAASPAPPRPQPRPQRASDPAKPLAGWRVLVVQAASAPRQQRPSERDRAVFLAKMCAAAGATVMTVASAGRVAPMRRAAQQVVLAVRSDQSRPRQLTHVLTTSVETAQQFVQQFRLAAQEARAEAGEAALPDGTGPRVAIDACDVLRWGPGHALPVAPGRQLVWACVLLAGAAGLDEAAAAAGTAAAGTAAAGTAAAAAGTAAAAAACGPATGPLDRTRSSALLALVNAGLLGCPPPPHLQSLPADARRRGSLPLRGTRVAVVPWPWLRGPSCPTTDAGALLAAARARAAACEADLLEQGARPFLCEVRPAASWEAESAADTAADVGFGGACPGGVDVVVAVGPQGGEEDLPSGAGVAVRAWPLPRSAWCPGAGEEEAGSFVLIQGLEAAEAVAAQARTAVRGDAAAGDSAGAAAAAAAQGQAAYGSASDPGSTSTSASASASAGLAGRAAAEAPAAAPPRPSCCPVARDAPLVTWGWVRACCYSEGDAGAAAVVRPSDRLGCIALARSGALALVCSESRADRPTALRLRETALSRLWVDAHATALAPHQHPGALVASAEEAETGPGRRGIPWPRVVVSESLTEAHEDVRDAVSLMGGVVVERHWRDAAIPQFKAAAAAAPRDAVASTVRWHGPDPIHEHDQDDSASYGPAFAPPTHLVAGSAARRVNVLCAIASGAWVVSADWALEAFAAASEGECSELDRDSAAGSGAAANTSSDDIAAHASSAGSAGSQPNAASPAHRGCQPSHASESTEARSTSLSVMEETTLSRLSTGAAAVPAEAPFVIGGALAPHQTGPSAVAGLTEWLRAVLVSCGPVPPASAGRDRITAGRATLRTDVLPSDLVPPGANGAAGGSACEGMAARLLLSGWAAEQVPGAAAEAVTARRVAPFAPWGWRCRLWPDMLASESALPGTAAAQQRPRPTDRHAAFARASAAALRLAEAAQAVVDAEGASTSWARACLLSSVRALRCVAAVTSRSAAAAGPGRGWMPRGVFDGWIVLLAEQAPRASVAWLVAQAGGAWVQRLPEQLDAPWRAVAGMSEFAKQAARRGAPPRVVALLTDGASAELRAATAKRAAQVAAAACLGFRAALRDLDIPSQGVSIAALGVRHEWMIDVLSTWPPVSPLASEYRVTLP